MIFCHIFFTNGRFSQVTVSLLQQSLQQQQHDGPICLIDGFPRNIDNLHAWEEAAPQRIALVLELTAPHDILRERLLARQHLRSDDTRDVITKRFKVHCQPCSCHRPPNTPNSAFVQR